MTRPFLMGINSNLLLVAASPLFNGNPDYADLRNSEGVPLFSQQYDPSKWERAASAAKEFLDQYDQSMFQLYRKNGPDGQYSPYLSTRDVVLDDWNVEIIMARDRKSTRLNSSHVAISYAVFCLKKKNRNKQ